MSISTLLVAFALALDAFAVSVGISISLPQLKLRQMLRLAVAFGLFQFLMPNLGWWGGRSFSSYIYDFDHWVAFGLLFVIGSKMIVSAVCPAKNGKGRDSDPTLGISLLMLSIATSIDALAVGMSYAVLDISILHPSVVIGIVAFGLSFLGCRIGPFLGKWAGKWAELLGGVVLILIGVKILAEHL